MSSSARPRDDVGADWSQLSPASTVTTTGSEWRDSSSSAFHAVDKGIRSLNAIDGIRAPGHVLSMNLHMNEIRNLDGCARFSGLVDLNVSANDIESIDALSALHALTSLDVSCNRLRILPLAKLPAVTICRASMNAITALVTSPNASVTALDVSLNRLDTDEQLAPLLSLRRLRTLVLHEDGQNPFPSSIDTRRRDNRAAATREEQRRLADQIPTLCFVDGIAMRYDATRGSNRAAAGTVACVEAHADLLAPVILQARPDNGGGERQKHAVPTVEVGRTRSGSSPANASSVRQTQLRNAAAERRRLSVAGASVAANRRATSSALEVIEEEVWTSSREDASLARPQADRSAELHQGHGPTHDVGTGSSAAIPTKKKRVSRGTLTEPLPASHMIGCDVDANGQSRTAAERARDVEAAALAATLQLRVEEHSRCAAQLKAALRDAEAATATGMKRLRNLQLQYDAAMQRCAAAEAAASADATRCFALEQAVVERDNRIERLTAELRASQQVTAERERDLRALRETCDAVTAAGQRALHRARSAEARAVDEGHQRHLRTLESAILWLQSAAWQEATQRKMRLAASFVERVESERRRDTLEAIESDARGQISRQRQIEHARQHEVRAGVVWQSMTERVMRWQQASQAVAEEAFTARGRVLVDSIHAALLRLRPPTASRGTDARRLDQFGLRTCCATSQTTAVAQLSDAGTQHDAPLTLAETAARASALASEQRIAELEDVIDALRADNESLEAEARDKLAELRERAHEAQQQVAVFQAVLRETADALEATVHDRDLAARDAAEHREAVLQLVATLEQAQKGLAERQHANEELSAEWRRASSEADAWKAEAQTADEARKRAESNLAKLRSELLRLNATP